MADILKSFEVSEDGVSLNDEASILHGPSNPSLAPGQTAPIGSLYLRTGTAELYQKTGAVDVAWSLVTASTPANSLVPVVQLRRSATQALTTSFVDLNFDITDMETDATIIEHDPVNIDRILIKESGLYGVSYSMSVDANATENVFNFRVRIDDTTVIPISNREISEDHEINAVSNTFHVELVAGQFLTVQIKSDGAGDVLWSTSNFVISKVSGRIGEVGPPGSGSTITLQEDGVNIPNVPHDTINFMGEVSVVDAGGGTANVVLGSSAFGTEFNVGQSLGVTSTTSTTLQNKLTLSVTVPAGRYRCGVAYGWNFNSTGNDFNCVIRQDGVQIGEDHRQEPKDAAGNFSSTGSNQKMYVNRTMYVSLSAGTYNFTVDFRTRSGGTTASIWDTVFEFWRVA